MKRRTRKKRGGMPQGPAPASSAEPEPPIEYVIKNTQANINSFKNDNDVRALLVNTADITGFNAMIQQMENHIGDEGFWIVEWNQARDPDDTYHYFHLAWTDDDTEPPDLIRFVALSGGRKKRKRKTKKKKRKKRRKKKTKRRRKRKKKTRRRKRTRRKRGGMDNACKNYCYKRFGTAEEKDGLHDVTPSAADKYCKLVNKETPHCFEFFGKCVGQDENGIAEIPEFTSSDIQHLPSDKRRMLMQLPQFKQGGGGNLFARGNQAEQGGHRSIDELAPDGTQEIAERIVTRLMQIHGYDRQTAVDDVVNTEESNDPDDVAQWRDWIARENRIVDPFVSDIHGRAVAERGAQQRAENEILVAQKEDGAVPSLRERAIGASKEGSSKEDEQLVMSRLNNQ